MAFAKLIAMEAAAGITSAEFKSVLDAVTGQLSVSTIIEVLGVAAGAAVGLVFMWWGVRKLIGILMNAFRKGKLGL